MPEPPCESQDRQHQDGHSEALVPRENAQLARAERQISCIRASTNWVTINRRDHQWKICAMRCSASARFELASAKLRVHTARNRVYQESAVRTVVKHQGAVLLSLALLAACGVPAPNRPRPLPGAQCQRCRARPRLREDARTPRPRPGRAIASTPPIGAARAGLSRRPDGFAGHNHVVSTHSLQGWAVFDGDPAAAAFALTAPVGISWSTIRHCAPEEGSRFRGAGRG